MNGPDDFVRHPNKIPDVPLPASNDLQLVREWAWRVLDSFGLSDWSFSFDNARRRLGQCDYGRRRITLSRHFVANNGPEEIRDTVLHEIAHALMGPGYGHGPAWKEMARRVGCRPERCGQAEMPRGKWHATCLGCSRTFHRHKRPLLMTSMSCGLCGRRRGVLIWERVEDAHDS